MDVMCGLSNLISDVVLIEMTYCASILLYEFILSSEFSMHDFSFTCSY
jgi:hypothetical protein